MSLVNKLFHFILLTCKRYNIDESHGMSHSMNVLKYANEIFEEESIKYPIVTQHEQIIYVSAALHDMCDKKYVEEDEAIKELELFMCDKMSLVDINAVKLIVTTMSYSKVKVNGFPNLGPYKRAYHIVREADLLSAYDFDRCMIYNIYKKQGNIETAFEDAINIFDNRVFKHNEDGLFITDYSKEKSLILESNALKQIDIWKKILKKPCLR